MKTPTIYQQFEKQLKLKGYSSETIPGYVRQISDLVWHYQRQPAQINDDELREYLIHLAFERKISRANLVRAVSALRAFFRYVLLRSETSIRECLPSLKTSKHCPEIYTPEEVDRLLAAKGLRVKNHAMLMTVYAAGLRSHEVGQLKVSDIRSDRMLIHVEESKDLSERLTILSPELLKVLRNYWRIYRPKAWLFPDPRHSHKPSDERSIHRTFNRALTLANLPDRGGVHSLRHSFAVHLLELNVDLPTVQRYLGHRWILSTAVYIHLMKKRATGIINPRGLLRQDLATCENGEGL